MSEYISLDSGSLDDVLVLKTVHEYRKEGNGPLLGHQVRYWCEHCDGAHDIGVHRKGEPPYKGGASWEWNGKLDGGVVLSPSQLCRTTRYPDPATDADEAEYEALRNSKNSFDALVNSRFGWICHTFIGINGAPPGHIIFLNDCTHAYWKGKTIALRPRREWGGMREDGNYWARIGIKGEPAKDVE